MTDYNLRHAVPGASDAPCEVCGDPTIKRIEIGDGFAAICSPFCLHAWPRVWQLIRERDAARDELGLVVSASLLCEGETLREPEGMRGAAVAAMLNTMHRLHEAQKNAPPCQCGRLATCIGRSEAGIDACCDECCGHGQEDSTCVPIQDVVAWALKQEAMFDSEITAAVARAESAELGCAIAYRREPTPDEGDAFEFEHHQSMGPVEKSGETHVPAGNWHGHRCTCGKWVWGGGTVCQGCVDAQAVRTAVAARDAALARCATLETAIRERDERLERVEGARPDCVVCRWGQPGPHDKTCPLYGWKRWKP